MSNAIYPVVRGMGLPVMKTSEESTIVQSAPNFITTRIAQSQNPLWHWTLIYNYLKNNPLDVLSAFAPYTDYQVMQGFWLARNGQADDFLFDDPTDDYVGPAITSNGQFNLPPASTGTPNTAAELQVVTDGTFFYSPLQRNFGGLFQEDITDLNTINQALVVYANGTKKTGGGTDYTLLGPGLSYPGAAFMGLYLKWASSPATPVTAQFNFYFRVRFESDQQDFEQFLGQVWHAGQTLNPTGSIWTVGGPDSKNGSGMLKLVTSRGPSL